MILYLNIFKPYFDNEQNRFDMMRISILRNLSNATTHWLSILYPLQPHARTHRSF